MRAKLPMIVFLILSVLCLIGGVWLIAFSGSSQKPELVETLLEEPRSTGIKLRYNSDYARFPAGHSGGRMDSLDLAAFFPGFAPAGNAEIMLPHSGAASDASMRKEAEAAASQAMRGEREKNQSAQNIIFLHVAPPSRTVPPEERVISLYGHFLEPEAIEDANGLIVRKFQKGSPYEGEDLYFAPPDGAGFAARCAPVSPELPSSCLATFLIGPVEMDLRFDRSLLAQWEQLSEGARTLTMSFLAQ